MVEIVLTHDQAKLFDDAKGEILILRPDGRVVAELHGGSPVRQSLSHYFTDEQISQAVHRINSPGPWYTTDQVLAHLKSIETR